MKKILVTGGTGFLGKSLSLRLVSSGYDVTAMGRDSVKGLALEKSNITYAEGDLRDQNFVRNVTKKVDIVFHCGALSSIWGHKQDFISINVDGTQNIIDGCLENSVQRLIYVSSPSIYSQFANKENLTEKSELPQNPLNFYAASKLISESRIDLATKKGLQTFTIRPRAIFGPEDQTIFPRLIRLAEKGSFPLLNQGLAKVDLTYVENVVDSLILCMQADEKFSGQKYNITNGQPTCFVDLVQKLFQLLNLKVTYKHVPVNVMYLVAAIMEGTCRLLPSFPEPKLTRATVGYLAYGQTFDITKARQELGYSPQVSLDDGLLRFAKWWMDEKSSAKKS